MVFFGTLLLTICSRLFKIFVEDKFFRFKMIFLHQHGQRAETNKQTNQKNLACPTLCSLSFTNTKQFDYTWNGFTFAFIQTLNVLT